MEVKHYQVAVERDHLKKLSASRPIPAIAEIIWNALDADATRVDVEYDKDSIGRRSITIKDNGTGMTPQDVERSFSKLGGSWKAHGQKSRQRGRILHGKEGKGRFKALALGRVAKWTSIYRDGDQTYRFTATISSDDIRDVRVTEPDVVSNMRTGVEVFISELERDFRSLDHEQSIPALAEIFAIYLTDYRDAAIYVENQKVDPREYIKSQVSLDLPDIETDDLSHKCKLNVIEWKSASERWLFLCGEEGFPLHRITPRFHSPGHQFSAYLKSSYVITLQEQGLLELAEMNPPLIKALESTAEAIKAYFRDRDIEAISSEIDQWKAQEIYPYERDPETAVEKAERKVFDIVALNVKKHLGGFQDLSKKTKAFQLRMLRQGIERGPEELQHILTEVLELPENTRKELSKLLKDAALPNIIAASRMVTDRLKFVHGLEHVLFHPEIRAVLKERSQLHRMIADNNTWIFGEEFNLTVSDQSLTAVLKKHKSLLGDEIVIDGPVKRIDGKVCIVDLMLSRSVPQNHKDELEHLVVELKRPSVKIGSDEITQIKRYAFTVADDERFQSLKTRWSFWVVSSDMDSYAKAEIKQKNKPRGMIYQSDEGHIEIWVKTWSEIIADCKARMNFVQKHLDANVDTERSFKYLQTTYARYLGDLSFVSEEESELNGAEVVEVAE
ncbi:hypothetical protein RvVAR0630_15720 [Agrobacterium vitis]|uniref:ATP-binding protein n=1 Tax=Agrobacterium vitis TaxID=373 RepID=UPI0015DCE7AC|nr:ATP-binding protein [Agrobacterium vitis]BCH58948.1 hypothetical protein RvVAR0630_15720 [Agrobacterium vitis]